jgi:hypothetical protein
MSVTTFVSPVTGRTVRLHWKSWLARMGGQFNCMTLTKSDIFIAQDWIGPKTLAHEDAGHTVQAARLGWRYLPWVLFHYAKSGYANSLPERDADEQMEKYHHLYTAIGDVPSWVVEKG